MPATLGSQTPSKRDKCLVEFVPMTTQKIPPPKRRPLLPAWLLSALLHLLLVLASSFVLMRGPQTGGESSNRPVSIVLSRTSGSQTDYVSPEARESQDQPATASEAAAAQALPSLDAAAQLLTRAIELPTATDTPVASSQLVDVPRFTVSGRARLPSSLNSEAIAVEQAARRAAVEARGPVARLGLFGGSAAAGRSFVFLIDRSKSMGSQGLGGLEAAEQELMRALAELQPKHWFQVIAYHHRCVFLRYRKLLRATDENKVALRGHISGLAAFGATEHEMALMSALYLEPDVIFLLTDGGDPVLSNGQLKRIRKLARGRTAIHCIQFGFGPLQSNDTFLHRLAAQNGGGYGYVEMSK